MCPENSAYRQSGLRPGKNGLYSYRQHQRSNAYYLDAFNSYLLCTWLLNVYCGHDNWYTRGASFPILLY
ncbi:hypothetical protein V6Z11_A06G063700 [Gossypium hirsutum]